jgi:voltage-gated potassium channel
MLSGMPRPRAQSFLRQRTQAAVANRRVFPYLALVTFLLGLLGGFVITLVDRQDFPTFGDGVWWAIVTLGTVGYGDLVPRTPLGRLVGSALIVFGVTFIAFLTATVTSAFVSTEQQAVREAEQERREEIEEETRQLLRNIAERLAAIEAKLDRSS